MIEQDRRGAVQWALVIMGIGGDAWAVAEFEDGEAVRQAAADDEAIDDCDADALPGEMAARDVQEVLGRPLGSHLLTAGPVVWNDGA